MAEEFQLGRGNWWESSSSSSTRNKFHSGILSSSATNTTTTPSPSNNFDWPTEIVDIKDRSSLNPGSSVSDGSMVFQADSHKLGRHVLPDPNLQLVGLGLSSQGLDWNQSFFRGEKSGSDYSYEQEATTACHEQDHQWTQKTYNVNSDESSVVNEYKQQMNRGMSLEHHQQPVVFNNLESSNYVSPSNMLQGLLLSDHQTQQEAANFTNAASLYYNDPTNNPMPASSTSSSWSKFPQFLRTSPPKHQWPAHVQSSHNFTNTTPFWNASMDDVRSGFIPSLQPHIPNTSVDEKPKHTVEVRDINRVAKKSNSETSNKRPRNETPSSMPAFKVRKEKTGDRITALQQLVSPFGKTDTASVLSEAIEYIKFLHQQVNALSSPYMKSGVSMQHHQTGDKSNNPEGAKTQDLRSRGLCLVPVSSTFPVIHETAVDFWNPTFGGTFR